MASADDALTLLCHLGYLCHDAATSTARVPNEEVRAELADAVSESRHAEVARIVRDSDALLEATWDMDEDAVADAISRASDSPPPCGIRFAWSAKCDPSCTRPVVTRKPRDKRKGRPYNKYEMR